MSKNWIIEKEKLYSRINPSAIYIGSIFSCLFSLIGCVILYTTKYEYQAIWVIVTIVTIFLVWFVALMGLFSYFYGRKYGVDKPKKLLIICFAMILLGVIVFVLVQKIAP